jgi:glutathione peroxidase-family protein
MKSMFENFHISKFVFDSPLYHIALSQTSNSNNSANLKQNFKIFLVVYQGTRWNCFIKMNGGEKSCDTVPLSPFLALLRFF